MRWQGWPKLAVSSSSILSIKCSRQLNPCRIPQARFKKCDARILVTRDVTGPALSACLPAFRRCQRRSKDRLGTLIERQDS